MGSVRRWCRSLTVAFVLLAASPSHAQPVFSTWQGGFSFTKQSQTLPMSIIWFDTDPSDPGPEPVWLRSEGLEQLRMGVDGAPVPLSVGATKSFAAVLGQEPRGFVVDIAAPGDGEPELLFVGHESILARWDPEGTHRLDRHPIPLPAIRAHAAIDGAVGDLNRDGLPDLALALAPLELERSLPTGEESVLLLNRGDGRFEAVPLQPRSRGRLSALAMADVDRDGRLDLVEALDLTGATERARVLFNRTPPGQDLPTFEARDLPASGPARGVAVADLDGDGLRDVYVSGVGFDLFARARPDGTFEDRTLEAGFIHRLARHGFHQEWSPLLVDLDADGHLDVLARHGIDEGSADVVFQSARGADVLYVGDGAGGFERVAVPFDMSEPPGLRSAVGDLDDDGLPDVVRDGPPKATRLWHNETPLGPGDVALTVRFAPTVSGTPATGVEVVAFCGGETQRRELTSGGLAGVSSAPEVHVAWRGCAGPVLLDVRWPSGVVQHFTVPADEHVLVAEEPRWLTWSPWEPGAVTVDPAAAKATRACLSRADGSEEACCEAHNGPCAMARPGPGDQPVLARLGEARPMLLQPTAPRWLLYTQPPVPRPGTVVALHLVHLGDPNAFSAEGATLRVDGVVAPWETVDTESRQLIARVSVPIAAGSIEVAAEGAAGLPLASWSVSTAVAWTHDADLAVYPIAPPPWSGVSADGPGPAKGFRWAAYVRTAPGVTRHTALDRIGLTSPEGEVIPFQIGLMVGAPVRVPILVDWSLLPSDEVWLRCHPEGDPIALPVVRPADDLELLALAVAARGNVGTRFAAPVHDSVPLLFSVLDAQGRTLPLRPDQLELEADHAVVVLPPGRNGMAQDMGAMMQTTGGEGPDSVRVRAVTGQLLGELAYTRVAPVARTIDYDASWVDLSPLDAIEVPREELLRVEVALVDAFGDLCGADAWPDIDVEGGTFVLGPVVWPTGRVLAKVAPDPGAQEISVSVRHAGQLLAEATVPVVWGPAPPPGAGPDAEPSVPDVVDTPEEVGPIDITGLAGDGSVRQGAPRAAQPGARPRVAGCGVGPPTAPAHSLPLSRLVVGLLLGVGVLRRRRPGRPLPAPVPLWRT